MGSPGCGKGRLSIFSHIFNYYLIHAFYTILPASPSATAAPHREGVPVHHGDQQEAESVDEKLTPK